MRLATRRITVSIIEQQAETRQQVRTLAAESPHLDVHVLEDAAAAVATYGASGPDVLLVGLDTEPQGALAAAKQILIGAPACGVIVYGGAVATELLAQALAAGARQYLPYP